MIAPRRWVKICGVRDPDEALAIAELGASAVGLNLWRGSPRFVDDKASAEICEALAHHWPEVERVGVTVNFASSVSGYQALMARAGLTCVQLHGDEPPSLQVALVSNGVSVIRAIGLDGEAWSERAAISAQIKSALSAGCRVLLDARVPGMYGGTGRVIDRALLRWLLSRHRLIVAGGLTPVNVGELASSSSWSADIQAPGMEGLDVASGVEGEGGRKDLEAAQRFLEAVG